MTLFGLVRHGQTDYNRQALFQGSGSDMPLNATGREQAHHALDHVPDISWDAVIASPLRRAEETARIIAADHRIAFAGTDPRLVEIDWGSAEGRDVAEMEAAYPGRTFPGREELQSVTDRATAAIADLSSARPGQNLLLVAHGTLIRLLLSGITDEHFPSIPNGTLTQVRVQEDSWTVSMVAGETVRFPPRSVPLGEHPRFDLGSPHLSPFDLTSGRA